ncbi:putative serine/threonine-protein kinase-like protein CCR3 [Tanacetum coccineum]|uniref:Serine/threonine-protein kinase-like protein CCR3 n=1 Tax=Tanacetum coccineum TaxID=301880 RepID=A0ABQ4Y7L7_9ASTR
MLGHVSMLNNVLSSITFILRVSDFGLSLMGPDLDSQQRPTKAAGTVGYIDPKNYGLNVVTGRSERVARISNEPNAAHPGIILMTRVDCANKGHPTTLCMTNMIGKIASKQLKMKISVSFSSTLEKGTWPGLLPHAVSFSRLLELVSNDCSVEINETGTKLKHKLGREVSGA